MDRWRAGWRRAARGPWVWGAACALAAVVLAWERIARAAPTVAVVVLSLILLVPSTTRGLRSDGEAGSAGRPATTAALAALLLLLLPYRAFVAGGLGGGAAFGLIALGLFLLASGREIAGAAVLGPAVLAEPGLAVAALWFAARRRFRAAATFAASAAATFAASLLAGDFVPRLARWAAGVAGGRGATEAGGAGVPAVASDASLWTWGARLWPGSSLGPLCAAVVLAALLFLVARAARRASPDRAGAPWLPFLALAVAASPLGARASVLLVLPGALPALRGAWATLPRGRRERFVILLSAAMLLAGFDLSATYGSVFLPSWAARVFLSVNTYALLAVFGLGLYLARSKPGAAEGAAPASRGEAALDLARAALPVLGAGFVALWGAAAFLRVLYPFELEWMEGATVEHVLRVLEGRALYAKPSLEFVPFVYTPLYAWLGALVSWPLGVGFGPLRLLSALCTAGSLALLFRTVQRETGSASWGLVAAGLFAATYRVCGTWFDLARVDALFLFLLLSSLYVLRFRRSAFGLVAAGLLGGLAFLAKQTALLALAPAAAHEVWRGPRRSVWFVGTLAAVVGSSTVALDAAYGGWYAYYVFELPSRHPLVPKMWVEFWRTDLLGPLAIAAAIGLMWFFFAGTEATRERFWLYAAAAAGLLGASWSGRLHEGGHPNVLMPACAAVALCFGLGGHRLLELACGDGSSRRAPWLAVGLLAVCAAQFAVLDYPLARQVASPADERAGRALVERIRGIEGDVWMPSHGFWTRLAGKPSFVHRMAADDVVRSGDRARFGPLEDEIRAALAARRFGAVIVSDRYFRLELERSYRLVGPVVAGEGVLVPRAGEPFGPGELFVPR